MKDTPVQSVQAHSSSPTLIRHQDHLKPGSPVLVRIIGSRGNGKYEASVAGARIILTSTKDLKPGDTFTGKIGLKNGFITISPAETAETAGLKEILVTNLTETGGLSDPNLSPAIASLLASLNLPSDSLSLEMVLQFKQLGMKLNPAVMKKIRQKAESSANPKKTLEKEIIKAQKKLLYRTDETEDEVPENYNENPHKNQNFYGNNPENSEMQDKNKDSGNWLSEIKSFIETITTGKLSNSPGKLTVMNHTGFFKNRLSENTWITVPFEITNPFEETVAGDGKIMLLLGSSDKTLKQINLHINYEETKWCFIISREMKNISCSGQGEKYSETLSKDLERHFLKSGKIVTVKQVPFELIEETGSGLETISTVEGHI